MFGSIVDPVVGWATSVIGDLGAAGVFILMTLESALIPVPSEAIMLFAGFNVAQGKLTLLEIVVAGVAGNVVGSWIAWGLGRAGRVELLEQHGKWFHVSKSQLARADRWFQRWGSATVFFARMVPIVRTFISLPAGVARMPFWRFTLLTTLGCIPWVLMLGLVGQEVGPRWQSWRDKLHYLDYAVLAAIVLLIGYWLIRRRNQRRTTTDAVAP